MNQQADPVFETPEQRRKLNPWFSMWIRPRETIRQLLWAGTHSYHWVWLVVALAGVQSFLFQSFGSGDWMALPLIFVTAILAGPIGSVIGWGLYCLFIMLAGKVLGGKATFKEVSLALGWAMVPVAWGVTLWPLKLILFGEAFFKTGFPGLEGFVAWLLLVLFVVVDLTLIIWSFVISVGSVAEVYGFSNGKGFGTVLLAGVFISILSFILALPFLLILFMSAM